MNIKRILCVLAALLLLPLGGCAQSETDDQLTVIATLFPQYDFARQIGGEHVNVTLLLPAGTESHTYEPTPRDMAKIQDADLFVYTGEEMEPWAATLLSAIDQSRLVVVDASSGVELVEEEHAEGNPDGHTKEEHDHELDPHIWLDPTLAQAMVDNVAEGLAQADPDHAQEYLDNAESYKQQLAKLDEDYQAMISSAKRTYLVFGGRFSYGYLMRRYHLTYDCAYDSCSAATEPSVKVMARLIDDILKNDLPAVYHEELASTAVTDALCEKTGAKSLLLHSAHNLSAEDMQAGKTFLDVMYDNLESLREGLN